MSRETPLHIVVLGSYMRFPHGMATTSRVRLVGRALTEAGNRVLVLCPQATERPPRVENRRLNGVHEGVAFEYTTWTTVRHRSFIMRRLVAAWGWTNAARRLVCLRRQGRLDVAYLWPDTLPGPRQFLAIRLLALLRVPIVGELNENPRPSRVPAVPLRSPLTGMAGVVSISGMLSAWAGSEARRLGRNVKVIDVPILVDIEEQPLAAYHSDGPPTLLFAGSPEYNETIDFILAAMDHVWREIPDCRLIITGANREDPKARWLFAAERHDPRVHLAGYVSRDELLLLYRQASALLIPLFDDARSTARFPTKIGEYLASGRPVVTTAVGEIPRYFQHGVDAAISPPGDIAAYATEIVRLLKDPEMAARMGREGRRLAASRFHYAKYADTLHRGFAAVAEPLRPAGRSAGG